MSFDGNFGLVHKRTSGRSLEQPLHGDRVFVDDYVAREPMAGYTREGKMMMWYINFYLFASLNGEIL